MARNPLVFTTGVFICGIVFGHNVNIYPFDLIGLCISLLILPLLPEGVKTFLLTIALIAAGSLRLHLARDVMPEDHIRLSATDSIVAAAGTVESAVIARDGRNQYRLALDSSYSRNGGQPASGNLIIFSRDHPRILKYGYRVRLCGRVQEIAPVRNPGQFDYRSYLAAQGVYHSYVWKDPDSVVILSHDNGNWLQTVFIQPIAGYARDTFHHRLSADGAALVQALLLGDKQDLEKDRIAEFQKVGVVHVLAISGLHVGFIIVFTLTGLSLLRIPRDARFWLLLVILFLYGAVVQFRPPVVRASLMAVFYLYAEKIERKPNINNILSGSALIILMADPQQLFNPGFQFSFVAVGFILHGAGRFDRWIPLRAHLQQKFPGSRITGLLINTIWMPLLVSFAAVAGTLPLTAYYYGLIPLVALLANLMVIPLIAVIVLLALFLLLLHPLSGFIAGGIGDMIDMIRMLLELVVERFAGLPLASLEAANPPMILVLLATGALLLFLHADDVRMRRLLMLLGTVIAVLVILPGTGRDRSLRITFLDVGQGDAAHLRFPNGRTMLIDAGGADRRWDNGLMAVLPFLKKTGQLHLDYLVASHAHDDHIGGIPSLLRAIEVDTVIMNAYPYRSKRFRSIHAICREQGIPVTMIGRGDRIHADPACRIYVLHPDSVCVMAKNFSGSECNNSSLVLKVQYGSNGILFTGDLEKSVEPRVAMYGRLLESEILKVGHHGSNTSTSDEFLELVGPVFAVIPVALKNKFKHPSPKTLERLRSRYIKIYRTSHTGAVMFRIYPEHIEKVAWRSRAGG